MEESRFEIAGLCFIVATAAAIWASTVAAAELPQGSDRELLVTFAQSAGGDRSLEAELPTRLSALFKGAALEQTRGAVDEVVYQNSAHKVAFIFAGDGSGSGAIISPDGGIVTNAHVVGNKPAVLVLLKPRDATIANVKAYRAQVVRRDDVRDLALVRIVDPPPALASFALGNASQLAVGQDVHAIGHPRGQSWTYSQGVVSQLRPGYEWQNEHGEDHRADVIQTQTPINPGNSGGPLLDDDGRLVGLNSFIQVQSEGLNFAIAINEVASFLASAGPARRLRSPEYEELKCEQQFSSRAGGPTNAAACYLSAHDPPPDIWLVSRDANEVRLAHHSNALTGGHAGFVNTVGVPTGAGDALKNYVDVDCDGYADIVGDQSLGDAGPSSYALAPTDMRMQSLIPELFELRQRRTVEYLRVCGAE